MLLIEVMSMHYLQLDTFLIALYVIVDGAC